MPALVCAAPEHGSNPAEFQATAMATLWLAQAEAVPFAVIRPDSENAELCALGVRRFPALEPLSTLLRQLYMWTSSLMCVALLHVEAHAGEPWNEAADAIAKFSAAHRRRGPVVFGAAALTALPGDVEWMWLRAASDDIKAQYPPMVNDSFVITPESRTLPSCWRAWAPRSRRSWTRCLTPVASPRRASR